MSPEEIPDEAVLYRRVHQKKLNKTGQPRAGAFTNAPDGGMSTEWNKYATPLDTKNRASHFRQDPAQFAVVSLPALGIRSLDGQRIAHTPRSFNCAHTDVFGPKDEEIRLAFVRMSRLVAELG